MTDEIKPLRDDRPRKVKFSWKVAIGLFMTAMAAGWIVDLPLTAVIFVEGIYLILMGMSEVFE
jgi:hypothetical protein